MVTRIYVIDTSSFIEMNRHNPMDIYQTPWQKVEGLIKSGRLVAPREVLDEITRLDDSLAKWARKHQRIFIDPTKEQIEIVREILEKYPGLIKTGKRYAADPWVIALAIEMVRSPQSTLYEVKRIVVTEEKIRGNKVKIPYVCREYGVEAINILDMFRIEGWKF